MVNKMQLDEKDNVSFAPKKKDRIGNPRSALYYKATKTCNDTIRIQ
jgi:hypothetical protein